MTTIGASPGATEEPAGSGTAEAATATAQMRRDRDRLALAQAEIAALRQQVRALQAAPEQRARRAARRAFHALPPGIQALARQLRPRTAAPPAPTEPAPTEPGSAGPAPAARATPFRGTALVIDDHWPQPDRDAGSIEIVNLVRALSALGFNTTLAAARELDGPSAARDALVRSGIHCLLPAEAASMEEFLVRRGEALDLCVLCRVYCGGRFLDAVRRHCLKARVVFDSIDLGFLREQRKAQLLGDAAALAVAEQVRAHEEAVIRGSDATVVVSRAELELLRRTMPDVLVVELPLARALAPSDRSFAERRGIGFIGGFAHAPNLDAMRHFLAETWPLVLRELPELEMTIVGADPPPDLLDGVPGRVRALGHLPDVGPWFAGLRLTVAPLRFGAGAKGKVASSLAAGVPCIATPVAAEGMSLSADSGVLVADDPAGFAARLRDAYTDPELWARLSVGGLAHARRELSLDAWQARLDALLRRIGL